MADQYTPDEIQEIFERYHDAVRRGIPISESLAKEMNDAVKGVKNYTNALNFSIKQLGTSVGNLTKDINNGARGAAAYNDSINAGADVISKVMSQFGLLGRVVGGVVKVFGFFVGAVNKQSDALYKAYQDISRAGAVGAGGMTEVYDNMRRFGYTVDQLNEMGALLRENSKNFGAFTSSALDGTRQFGKIADDIQNSPLRRQFFNLGLTVTDINKGIAGLMSQEGRLGQLRGRTQDELSKKSAAYIREMEILTRLTGQQREDMEEQRRQALEMDEFYSAMMDAGESQQKEINNVLNFLGGIDKKYMVGFARSLNGILDGSKEQEELMFATNFQLLEWGQQLKSGAISADEFKQRMTEAVAGNKELAKNMGMLGIGFMGSLQTINILSNKGLDPFADATKKITGEVDAAAMGFDKSTDAQSRMRDNQIKQAQAMQDLLQMGVTPLTKAMAYLSDVVTNLTDMLPGSNKSLAQNQQSMGVGGAVSGAVTGAGLGFAYGGPLGAVLGGIGGGVGGYYGGRAAGKALTTPRRRLDQLGQPGAGDLAERIIQAESGGRNVAEQGGRSSAFGVAQITKDTFEGLVKNAQPDSPLRGKTFEDMKTDVALQRVALDALLTQNAEFLNRRKLEASDTALYLAHFLGAAGASRVLEASDRTLIQSVVSPSAIEANPDVFRNIATVKDLKNWASRKIGATDVSGASGWQGSLSGPMSGYRPNILMHGNEDLIIRPTNASTAKTDQELGNNVMRMIEKLDEMVYLSKAQLFINEKIMRAQT
jgi:hypothetical protein